MRKLFKRIGLIFILYLIASQTSSTVYAARLYMELDGYYGGGLVITGDYQITGTNPYELDTYGNGTLTLKYNNFSVYPSLSVSGVLQQTIEETPEKYTWTTSGNLEIIVEGTRFSIQLNIQYIETEYEWFFSPGSYLLIDGIRFPVTDDLIYTLSNVTWFDIITYW